MPCTLRLFINTSLGDAEGINMAQLELHRAAEKKSRACCQSIWRSIIRGPHLTRRSLISRRASWFLLRPGLYVFLHGQEMSSVSAPIPPKHTRRQLQEDRRAVSRPTIPCDPRLQPLKLVYTSLTRVPSLEVRPSTEKQFGRSSAHFSSASPTVPRWPDHPQRFGRWRPHRVTDDALNFLLLLGSISFIVMAALAAHLDRKQAATPDELDSIAWARNLVWFTTTLVTANAL